MGRRRQLVYVLLFLYIGVSLTYQIANSVFLITVDGDFNPSHQVEDPFQFDFETGVIGDATTAAKRAGIVPGDHLESINHVSYTGLAQWQRTHWYARVGDTVRVGVRHANGSYSTVLLSFEGWPQDTFSERAFLVFLIIGFPLFCLGLGYWVALARPSDWNAWFILLVLSYPSIFNAISTHDWPPGFWLGLRLYWHLLVTILAPTALLWLGLFFPERSRIDIGVPWMKWMVLGVVACGFGIGLVAEYAEWNNRRLFSNAAQIFVVNDTVMKWILSICLILYLAAIFEKLSSASSADSRRRIRVLCLGSGVGLGSLLFFFSLLPWFGIANPGDIKWLDFLSGVLVLAFPLSLAYVVIVQRALDVRVLVRMGTKYALARTTLVVVERAIVVAVMVYFIVPGLRPQGSGSMGIIVSVLAAVGIIGLWIARRRLAPHLQNWLDRKFFREAYNAELVLSELAEHAHAITNTPKLIQTVSRRISEVLHVPNIAVFLRGKDSFQLELALGLASETPVTIPTNSVSPNGRTAAIVRSQQGHSVLGGEYGQRVLDAMSAEAVLLLPGRTKLMGLMVLGPKLSEEAYSPSDLRLLESVAVQTGLGLEVAELAHSLAEEAAQRERMQREVEIAAEVQQRLFPQCTPEIPGIDLAGGCRPALGVGGDYYDMFKVNGDCLALALGDVSGKGISAALLMAGLRASLRAIADEGCDHLARIVTRLNKQVHEASAASRYATFFFAIYKPASGELRYVNAGHNPPFVIRDGCEAIRLAAGGMVVGLLAETTYAEGVVQLQSGDLLITYTDGVSEAMTVQDEEWGEQRMLDAAIAARRLPAKQLLEKMMEAADRFTGAAPQHDDMTLMVLKVGSVGLPATG